MFFDSLNGLKGSVVSDKFLLDLSFPHPILNREQVVFENRTPYFFDCLNNRRIAETLASLDFDPAKRMLETRHCV